MHPSFAFFAFSFEGGTSFARATFKTGIYPIRCSCQVRIYVASNLTGEQIWATCLPFLKAGDKTRKSPSRVLVLFHPKYGAILSAQHERTSTKVTIANSRASQSTRATFGGHSSLHQYQTRSRCPAVNSKLVMQHWQIGEHIRLSIK